MASRWHLYPESIVHNESIYYINFNTAAVSRRNRILFCTLHEFRHHLADDIVHLLPGNLLSIAAQRKKSPWRSSVSSLFWNSDSNIHAKGHINPSLA
jgi:hypothetical protein